MYFYIKATHRIVCFSLITGALIGCKKFIQIAPPNTSITSATVYSTNTSAAAAVTAIYYNMISSTTNLSGGSNSISTFASLEADELKVNSSTSAAYVQPYTNSLSSSTNGSSNAYFWRELYSRLYETNAILEGINNSSSLTDSIRQQLIGETEFMRAFFNFYAVNLYGDVPLVTTTNYQTNNTISRSPSSVVYQQILSDLKDAQAKLKNNYVDYQGLPSTSGRIRPNKGAATALLARVYLYLQKWDSAEAAASQLINDPKYKLADFTSSFTSTSLEAIWQLQPVLAGYNTFDGIFFVLTGVPTPTTGPVSLSSNLLTVFEASDKRLTNWTGSVSGGTPSKTYYFPLKYKINKTGLAVTEYTMVLRLAEQYLIRAEARAEQGNTTGAQNDLDTLRKRAGLPIVTANTQSSLLTAVMHERQVELFTEWGHRWFDLKRTKMLDSVMSVVCPQKGGSWSPTKAVMPLPLSELQANLNLTQNPGYN